MNNRLTYFIILTTFASFQHGVDARPPLGIVNGTDAAEGEFPYMVQLRSLNGYFECGGVILSAEWILTAGQCVGDKKVDSIVYGTNELFDWKDGYPNTSIKVKSWFQHPNYTVTVIYVPHYDVGLLQLEEPIPLSEIAQRIKLPEADAYVPFHWEGVLSGWGAKTTTGDLSRYLQKINLKLLTDTECTKIINDYTEEDSFDSIHNICSDNFFKGQCLGDSGSPYVINGTVFGLVSWSYLPCGIIPDAYSRLTNPLYRNWIKNVTGV